MISDYGCWYLQDWMVYLFVLFQILVVLIGLHYRSGLGMELVLVPNADLG